MVCIKNWVNKEPQIVMQNAEARAIISELQAMREHWARIKEAARKFAWELGDDFIASLKV